MHREVSCLWNFLNSLWIKILSFTDVHTFHLFSRLELQLVLSCTRIHVLSFFWGFCLLPELLFKSFNSNVTLGSPLYLLSLRFLHSKVIGNNGVYLMGCENIELKSMQTGAPGWLSWLSNWLLILAQGMILRCEIEPHVVEPARDSLSPCLSLCHSPAHALSVSLSLCLKKINFFFEKRKKRKICKNAKALRRLIMKMPDLFCK